MDDFLRAVRNAPMAYLATIWVLKCVSTFRRIILEQFWIHLVPLTAIFLLPKAVEAPFLEVVEFDEIL